MGSFKQFLLCVLALRGGGAWKEALERGWGRVGEGLGKGWGGVGEGLERGWGRVGEGLEGLGKGWGRGWGGVGEGLGRAWLSMLQKPCKKKPSSFLDFLGGATKLGRLHVRQNLLRPAMVLASHFPERHQRKTANLP